MSTFKEANLAEAGLQRLRSLSKTTNIKSESQTYLMFRVGVGSKGIPILRYNAFFKSDHYSK